MSIKNRVLGTPEARAAHRDARQRLAEVTAADRAASRHEETDEYLAANSKVIEAEKALPKWRRGLTG
jgi:hypothetical protein